MTYFESLIKPDWIPPEWAFPAAWFTLWTLQFFALLILVSEPSSASKRVAVALLVSQFVAAIAWQGVVFGSSGLTFAAWWLVGVLVLVVAATLSAVVVDWRAALLVAPTIVWMSVATTLGFALASLNPGA